VLAADGSNPRPP